jgi:hypothetical protein
MTAGMAQMRKYRFRALITFDPAARGDRARGCLDATHIYLVQPGRSRYFPAVISADGELPMPPAVPAVVTTALADGEVEAFFAPGQRFTLWANAVVGHTIRARGLAGHGVISRSGSLLPPRCSWRPG